MKARVLASRAGIVLALIMLFVLNSYAERKNELEQIPSRNTTKFELRVVSSDAVSVMLRWHPRSDASSYEVIRDGTLVGRSSASVGYFTDFDLAPGRLYRYSVVAENSSGAPVGFSEPLVARTGTSAAIRTRYKVLAIAFNPGSDSLVKENAFLQHRIQFLKLASLGSADIELYKGGIVSAPIQPAVDPGNNSVDYKDLVTRRDLGLSGYSIIDLIEKGEIDHVWVVKSSVDFAENALIGNRPIQGPGISTPNTWVPIRVNCSRSFFVNAYTPDARAYDAYAHMVEGVMTSISDGHPESWPRNLSYTVYTPDRSSYATTSASLNLWEKFRLADEWNGPSSVAYASKGNGNMGSSHFPPTSLRTCEDYCYFDLSTWQRYIGSAADDWLYFPLFSGAPRMLNGYDFGAFNHYTEGDPSYSDELGTSPELHRSFRFGTASFHQWWFAHLPHNAGVTDGILNNWWPYLYDFNRFDGVPVNFEVTGIPTHRISHHALPFNPNNVDENNWGYWNSENGWNFEKWLKQGELAPGAKVGRMTIVTRRDVPGINEAAFALSVTIENTQDFEEVGVGRNDVFYPVSRNAHWNLQNLRQVRFAVKPYLNPQLIAGTNPIVRLYKNGGQRIEFVPRVRGTYANMFRDQQFRDAAGWFRFAIPVAGDETWEKHIIGYIEPGLSASAKQAAQAQLEAEILKDVNYVEISIRSVTSRSVNPDDFVSYYIQGISFR